jgi:DNA polymerase-3 subunit alpha
MALGAVVTAIKRQVSKKSGAEFARLTVEDFSGSAEILVFPEAWAAISDRVRPDVPLLIKGGYSRRDEGADNPTFIVETVQRFEELRVSGQLVVAIDLEMKSQSPRHGPSAGRNGGEAEVARVVMQGNGDAQTVTLDVSLTPDLMGDVRQVIDSHPGAVPVEVRWSDSNGTKARFRSRSMKMAANGAALNELRALLGSERVRLVRGG